jgi:quercetin dioxygenase-like cupin family protein
MKRRAVRLLTCLPLLLLGIIFLGGNQTASAEEQSALQRKSLRQEDSPIPGYQMIMNMVEIPAGAREIRHTHPGPLAGYILEGTLVLENEGHPTTTYKAGESFFVAANTVHQGINTSSAPVKILATLMVEKGKPATIPAP